MRLILVTCFTFCSVIGAPVEDNNIYEKLVKVWNNCAVPLKITEQANAEVKLKCEDDDEFCNMLKYYTVLMCDHARTITASGEEVIPMEICKELYRSNSILQQQSFTETQKANLLYTFSFLSNALSCPEACTDASQECQWSRNISSHTDVANSAGAQQQQNPENEQEQAEANPDQQGLLHEDGQQSEEDVIEGYQQQSQGSETQQSNHVEESNSNLQQPQPENGGNLEEQVQPVQTSQISGGTEDEDGNPQDQLPPVQISQSNGDTEDENGNPQEQVHPVQISQSTDGTQVEDGNPQGQVQPVQISQSNDGTQDEDGNPQEQVQPVQIFQSNDGAQVEDGNSQEQVQPVQIPQSIDGAQDEDVNPQEQVQPAQISQSNDGTQDENGNPQEQVQPAQTSQSNDGTQDENSNPQEQVQPAQIPQSIDGAQVEDGNSQEQVQPAQTPQSIDGAQVEDGNSQEQVQPVQVSQSNDAYAEDEDVNRPQTDVQHEESKTGIDQNIGVVPQSTEEKPSKLDGESLPEQKLPESHDEEDAEKQIKYVSSSSFKPFNEDLLNSEEDVNQDWGYSKVKQTEEEHSGPNMQYTSRTVAEEPHSNFLFYFFTVCVLAVVGYVLLHNKKKIMALVIEGRGGRENGRRRPGTNGYKRLSNGRS